MCQNGWDWVDEVWGDRAGLSDKQAAGLRLIPVQGAFWANRDASDGIRILLPKPANALYLRNKESNQTQLVRLAPKAFDDGAAYWDLEDVLAWQSGKRLLFETVDKNGVQSLPVETRTHVGIDRETQQKKEVCSNCRLRPFIACTETPPRLGKAPLRFCRPDGCRFEGQQPGTFRWGRQIVEPEQNFRRHFQPTRKHIFKRLHTYPAYSRTVCKRLAARLAGQRNPDRNAAAYRSASQTPCRRNRLLADLQACFQFAVRYAVFFEPCADELLELFAADPSSPVVAWVFLFVSDGQNQPFFFQTDFVLCTD